MKKPMILILVVLVVIFGGIFGWYGMKTYFINKYFSTFVPPPQVVSTAIAKSENWRSSLDSVGSLIAVNGVDVSSEVSGQVIEIYFNSGENVKKGQPLIQLDDATERANLKDAEAQLKLAQLNDDRMRKLFKQGAAAQSSVDDSSTKLQQLIANVENTRSQIAKKLIRAPFNGKIGIKQVNLGQFIPAGYACASLQSSHTLNVIFTLPQQNVSQIRLNQEVTATTDSYPDQTFKGTITAIDSKIDESTRTIQVQATLENPENKLLPGMFVKTQVLLPSVPNSVTLPQTAISYTLYGESAFVVTLNGKKTDNGEPIGKVKQISVQTGDKQGNLVLILEGIKAGDMIVDSGQLKINDGDAVAINNSVQL